MLNFFIESPRIDRPINPSWINEDFYFFTKNQLTMQTSNVVVCAISRWKSSLGFHSGIRRLPNEGVISFILGFPFFRVLVWGQQSRSRLKS